LKRLLIAKRSSRSCEEDRLVKQILQKEPNFNARGYWETRLADRFYLRGVGDIGFPSSYNEYLYRVRANVFRLVLRSLSGRIEDWSVLDVGSGTGFYVDQWLTRTPARMMGADIARTAVRTLAERYPGTEFVRCDIGATLPESFEVGSFDVISAFDILFHIVDDEAYGRAIQNFSKLLKPNGYLVFSENLSDRLQYHGSHQVWRVEQSVIALLKDTGFEVQKVVPMFVIMNDPVRSRSWLMRRLFSLISRLAVRGEGWGRVIGAVLYPIEVVAVRVLSRGPSTEIFVCQKTG